MPEISVVMTAFQRAHLLGPTLDSIFRQRRKNLEVIVVEDGDDDGKTRGVCFDHRVRYYQRINRPQTPYSNPSVPINIGLRRALGEYVVLQNAECVHADQDVIEKLIAPIREDPEVVTFASVLALDPNGASVQWYCHPQHSARPFFFCGAFRREFAERLRGIDEDFVGYGYDDNDWALRLQFAGARFVFTDALVHHQWHPGTNCWGLETNRVLYERKLDDLMNGRIDIQRNLGREWGSLSS